MNNKLYKVTYKKAMGLTGIIYGELNVIARNIQEALNIASNNIDKSSITKIEIVVENIVYENH